MVGVVVTVSHAGRIAARGLRGDQRRRWPLRILRPRARRLASRRRGARLLSVPHQRRGSRGREDGRHLLRRARPGQPARRDGDCRAAEEGRHARGADRRRDRQGSRHRRRSPGGGPEPGRRRARTGRQRPADRARLGARGHPDLRRRDGRAAGLSLRRPAQRAARRGHRQHRVRAWQLLARVRPRHRRHRRRAPERAEAQALRRLGRRQRAGHGRLPRGAAGQPGWHRHRRAPQLPGRHPERGRSQRRLRVSGDRARLLRHAAAGELSPDARARSARHGVRRRRPAGAAVQEPGRLLAAGHRQPVERPHGVLARAGRRPLSAARRAREHAAAVGRTGRRDDQRR